MILNTRDKEIADQRRLNHFDPKSNLACNIYVMVQGVLFVQPKFKFNRSNFNGICDHDLKQWKINSGLEKFNELYIQNFSTHNCECATHAFWTPN